MHAIVHAVDVKYSDRLSGMIAEKLNKLGRIAADEVRGDVYLRRENKDGKLIKFFEVKMAEDTFDTKDTTVCAIKSCNSL